MKLIIVDKKETTIKTNNETLVVDTQKIPFRLIDTLLIVGSHALRTDDLTKMSASGINTVLLSASYKSSAVIASANGKSAELKLAQYHAATRYPITIAREILRLKVESHVSQLKKHEVVLDEMEPIYAAIAETTQLDTLLGIEGSFSRRYFSHYFALFPKSLHKGKRSKRPPLDPLNAMLSFCYMLLYHLIAVRLIAYGFEPSIGFLHRPFRDHYALASDLLEIFRADVNELVYTIFAQKRITPNDFTKKGGVYLRFDGRKKLWPIFREFLSEIEPGIDSQIADMRSRL